MPTGSSEDNIASTKTTVDVRARHVGAKAEESERKIHMEYSDGQWRNADTSEIEVTMPPEMKLIRDKEIMDYLDYVSIVNGTNDQLYPVTVTPQRIRDFWKQAFEHGVEAGAAIVNKVKDDKIMLLEKSCHNLEQTSQEVRKALGATQELLHKEQAKTRELRKKLREANKRRYSFGAAQQMWL